jgi:hypothetical protein
VVLKYLDWKPVPTGGEPVKELEQFLQDRAMEHDTRPCCSTRRRSSWSART